MSFTVGDLRDALRGVKDDVEVQISTRQTGEDLEVVDADIYEEEGEEIFLIEH